MTDSKPSSRRRPLIAAAAVLAVAALLAAALARPLRTWLRAGAPSDAPSPTPRGDLPPVPLPADCLIALRFNDLPTLCSRLGEILSAFDRRTDAAQLRRAVGERIGNADLAGVDTARPIVLFLLDPRKYPRPWGAQFTAADPEALKNALAGRGRLLVEDRRATWSEGEETVQALEAWRRANPGEIAFRAPGQAQARLAVHRMIQVYEAELARQVEAMKERMAQAIQDPGAPDRQTEIAAARADLDRLIATLKQVEDADLAAEMAPEYGDLRLSVKPFAGTSFARVLASHERGSTDLLARCPAEADVVAAHNVAVMDAVRKMVTDAFGLGRSSWFSPAAENRTGRWALALFLTRWSGPTGRSETTGRGRLQLLELADGKRADQVAERWARLAAGAAANPPPPFALGPAAREETGGRVALAAPLEANPAVLGEKGARAITALIGKPARAAFSMNSAGSAFAVGPDPLALLARSFSLGTAGAPLTSDKAFRSALEAAPGAPNLLVYVAPEGIRDWLRIADMDAGPVTGADRALLAWLRFQDDATLAAGVRAPTAALRRALTRPRLAPPAARPEDETATPDGLGKEGREIIR